MATGLINSFRSEWLKKKNTLAYWMVIAGAFFTPAIIIIIRLLQQEPAVALYADPSFWQLLWKSSWESMAIFLLPMGTILATSLVTQIEYGNNAWKQLHALPLDLSTIFISKLAVILLMLAQFLLLFNIGIYLSALVPYLLLSDVPYPAGPFPAMPFLRETGLYFIACLPIVAMQYLISLHFRNYLVPIGIGFLCWLAALAALPWRYNYLIPYSYTMLQYLQDGNAGKVASPPVDIHLIAIAYFIAISVLSYTLYHFKADRG